MAIKIKWNSLLRLSELDFIPEPPKVLELSDEITQSIAWLTGATRSDRRLLRCTEGGALLIAAPWVLYTAVESEELYPESGDPKTYTSTVEHIGIMFASGDHLVLAKFLRVGAAATEDIYISSDTMFWYPHKIISVEVSTVPDPGGLASRVGVNAYN